MMDDPDFNSSDIEYDFTPDSNASAGLRSISVLRERASEFRIESKKALRELQNIGGAPTTAVQRARWGNAWECFYTEVLRKNAVVMPTGEDLLRFFLMVPQMVKSSSDREAISWGTLVVAVKYTIHKIRCQHDSFKLKYNDRQKIKDVFETLRRDGKITTEPTRELKWITACLVAELSRALLVDAIRHGSTDWSVVVQKCLGLALQSALSSRVGDLAVSRYYEDSECLTYGDIQMKVLDILQSDDPNVPDVPTIDRVVFKANVKMRHIKGKKRNMSDNHLVLLESLGDVDYNVVDPLKLVLVHALRQGAVRDASTVEEAVENALDRVDGVIKWKYPQRPVMCALPTHKLDFTRGAKTQQLLSTLREAAALSGIEERLRTHDIRRGSARDAAQLPSRLNINNAALALAHSPITQMRGVTKRYVGRASESEYAERLQLDPDSFDLQALGTLTAPAPKRRKLNSNEIDGLLRRPEYAHLQAHKDPRRAASRKNAVQKTVASANQMQDTQVSTRSEGTDGQVSGPAAFDDVQDTSWSNEQDDEDIDPALLLMSGISSTATSRLAPHETMVHNAARICDYLEASTIDSDSVTGLGTATGHSLTTAQAEMRKLVAPPSEFMSWLSRINTRAKNDTNPAQHADLGHLIGGSRDQPTFFIHHCKNEADGCKFATDVGPSVLRHESICTPELREERRGKTEELACEKTECTYVARAETEKQAQAKLKRHTKERHSENENIACPIGGRPECGSGFQNLAALSHHKRRHHQPIIPQICPVKDCTSKTIWQTVSNLGDHLRGKHNLKGEELSDLVNTAKTTAST